MKKTIRLTESDLTSIIRNIILEDRRTKNNYAFKVLSSKIFDSNNKEVPYNTPLKYKYDYKAVITLQNISGKNAFIVQAYLSDQASSLRGPSGRPVVTFTQSPVKPNGTAVVNVTFKNAGLFSSEGGQKSEPVYIQVQAAGGPQDVMTASIDFPREKGKDTQSKCYNKYKPMLDQTIKKWKDWLKHPKTREKWRQNWCNGPFKDQSICKNEVNIFKKYETLLNNVNLDVDESSNPTAYGFVEGHDTFFHKLVGTSVDVNIICSNMDQNPTPEATMYHEVQHILHDIQPINPKSQVKDVFNVKNDKYEKYFQSRSDFAMVDQKSSIGNIKKQIGGGYNPEQIFNYWNNRFSKDSSLESDRGYACRVTEKESNVAALRSIFNKKPGQDITYAELEPYIVAKKSSPSNVYWFLACWWSQGFPDVNTMLQKANALAYQKMKLPNNQGYQNYT